MGKTILVVDDEPDIRDSVKTILEANGYNIETAVNGDDCAKKAPSVKPDLIVLDIMMPGTPVREILPKLKKFNIIFLSAVRTTEAEKEDLMKESNIVDFVEKPFDIDTLLKHVKKHV